MPRFQGEDFAANLKVLDAFKALAAEAACTPAQLCMAWLLAKDSVSTVLLGATKQHQLADNLGAAEIVMSEDELAHLDAATQFPPHYPSSNWVESMLPKRKKQ